MTTPIPTPSEPRTSRFYHAPPASTFSALGAVGTVCGATATFILVAGIARALGAPGTLPLVIGQVAFAAVAIAVALTTGGSARTLGLARPRAPFLLAAVLVGCSVWVLTAAAASLLPQREADTAHLQALATLPPAIIVYLSLAVVPALCEEIVFRGVLARGLASHLRPVAAAVVSAVLFAAYHLNLAQLAPTFLLGLVLALITLRAGSALPAMLVHALNNTFGLLFSRDPALARSLSDHSVIYIAGAAVLTAGGLALAARTPA